MKLVLKKPKKQDVYYALLLLPLLKMAIVSMLPQFEFTFNILLVIISIGLLFRLLIRMNYARSVSYFSAYLVLFNFVLLPVSVSGYNNSFLDIATFYGSTLYHVAFCLAILIVLQNDSHRLIHIWSIVMEALVVANAISVILFPDGLYTHGEGYQLVKFWILGYDNDHVIPYIITLLMVMLDNYITKKKVFSRNVLFLFSLCIGVSLYLWSVTAFISLILMAVLCLLYRIANRMPNVFNIRTFVLIVAIMMALIYFMALNGGHGGVLNDILVNVLNKDSTFNSRSWIWARYLVNIRPHLLFGNGYETAATLIAKNGVNGAHNEWLQILYDGGLIHLFFYFGMIYTMGKKMMRYKQNTVTYLISSAIFAILVIEMMVGCPKFYWLVLFTMGFCCSEIANGSIAVYRHKTLNTIRVPYKAYISK